MLIDITPPITDHLAVWPGDIRPRREVSMEIERGETVTLSSIHTTVHLGAHADAPSHYGTGEEDIAARSLDLYIGRCQVIRVDVAREGLVRIEDIRKPIVAARLLIRTGTYPDSDAFSLDFAALAPELVDDLHARGVQLIGIDTPSVDPFASKTLDAHRMFLRHDMAILEGLRLDHVPEGEYELIAPPLKLVGYDASPVRAVLRTLDEREAR